MSKRAEYSDKAAAIYCRSNSAPLLEQLKAHAADLGLEVVFNGDGVASADEVLDEPNQTLLPLFFSILVPDEDHFADFPYQVKVEDSDGRAHIGPMQIIPLPKERMTEASMELDKDKLDGDTSYDDLRAVRKQLGKTQVEFAKLMGVNVMTVSRWEREDIEPPGPAKQLAKVLLALKPATDLLYSD